MTDKKKDTIELTAEQKSIATAELKKINKNITEIKTKGKALQQQIQDTGLSILAFVDLSSNVTPATELVKALEDNKLSRNGLIEWFERFGKLRYDNKLKAFRFNSANATDIESATANPFWNYKPESEYRSFIFGNQLLSLVKTAQTKLDEASVDETIASKVSVNEDLLKDLQALVAKHNVTMQGKKKAAKKVA